MSAVTSTTSVLDRRHAPCGILVASAFSDFDTEHRLLGRELVGGRQHPAVCQHRLDRGNVVVATTLTLPVLPADFIAATAPSAMVSLPHSSASDPGARASSLRRPCCPSASPTLPTARRPRDAGGLHRISKAQRALLRIEGRRHAFNDADLVAGLELLRERSPASLAPARLSGPTKGTEIFFAASAAGSRRLSMLTTMTPLAIAACTTGTSALESAGAITRHRFVREHLLDQPDLTGRIDLVLDAVGDQIVSAGCAF